MAVNDTGGAALVSYTYDAISRLVARTATANGQTTTTRYLYDGWNRITECAGQSLRKTNTSDMDLSGTMQDAEGVGGLLSVHLLSSVSGSSVFYPAYDGNGNITGYLGADGTVLAHFEYDPFGNTVVSTDATNQFEYRFSTKPQDPATGLLYYGYRWYDPLIGRWPSRDPIAESGGLNLYGFVGNDGIDRLDYLGNIDLERLKQETGVAEAIASKTLLPVKGYIGWNRTTSCDDRCHVKFEIKEAYVGNYSYKNNEKHKAFGIYVYITGNLIERTDEECQDLRIVQYGRFIQGHDRSLPTGNPTNKVGIMNENRWWVDSTTEMQENGRPNVDSTGLADVDGLNFDLFDPPANSHDREPKRGIEFLTCAYARCRTKGGDLGPSRELGCLHWGFVPRVEKGKIAAVEPLRGTPEVLCNVTEHQGAMAKWMRKYGKNRN